MAALPYMQLYVADYLADTAHLDAEQHGAYLLLIMNYWQTGKPIPKNRLQAIARVSNDRWTTVEQALNEYFNDTGNHWQHNRIDADLHLVEESQSQRSKAGKASAEARKREKQRDAKARSKPNSNERSTSVQRAFNEPANDRSTNKEEETDKEADKETDTDTDTDEKKSPSPSGVDFLKHLVNEHCYPELQTRKNANNIAQSNSWHKDGVTISELDDAVNHSREQLSAKGDQAVPPIKYVAKVLASSRRKGSPVPAGKSTHTGFAERDYQNDPVASKFKQSGAA